MRGPFDITATAGSGSRRCRYGHQDYHDKASHRSVPQI